MKVGAVPRRGVVGRDADDDIVTGIVVMHQRENPSEVLRASNKDLRFEKGLPPGMKIEPYYTIRTWLMGKTLSTVFRNLVKARCWCRSCFICFCRTFAPAWRWWSSFRWRCYRLPGPEDHGRPANLLSLGAMDFGIIVDGAVIVIENILARPSETGLQRRATSGDRGCRQRIERNPVFDADHHCRILHPDLALQRHERTDLS